MANDSDLDYMQKLISSLRKDLETQKPDPEEMITAHTGTITMDSPGGYGDYLESGRGPLEWGPVRPIVADGPWLRLIGTNPDIESVPTPRNVLRSVK